MTRIQRIPHCSHWGAYSLLVDDGRIVGVEPFAGDPNPSEIIRSVPAWGDPRRRVLRPMARPGWLAAARAGRPTTARERAGRGTEPFVPLDWDEAIALVAAEIRRVVDTHGNRSVFAGSYGWTSAGRFHHASTLLRRTMNLVGGYTGHVDTYSVAAGPVILRHVLGSADACQGLQTTLDGVAKHTDTLVVFGAMSPRTAQSEAGGLGRHLLEDHLRAIVASGTRIVHVSPQRDDLPDWVGAEWWPIKPNTDTALMLALAREIVARGRHAAGFLETHCAGSELFLCHLAGDDDGVPKDADWAARITGIDAGRIRALADVLPATRTL
ncbi:MAG: biotin sulfoxide reductase, partial [Pseudomonadota bacterium]